jgi:hypothetical protein
MGNISVPRKVDPVEIRIWEKLFFGSRFTENGELKLRRISGVELWKNLIKKREKKFPTGCLRRWGKLGDILQ